MADRDLEQKTEQPTAHRREEARRRGQGPRSRDLAASVGLLGAFLVLRWLGPDLFETARSLVGRSLADLSPGSAGFTIAGVSSLGSTAAAALFLAVLPVLAGAAIVTVSASVVQGTAGLRFAALGPDFARIDPFEGAKKLFNMRSAARGALAVLKMALVAWLLARVLSFVSSSAMLPSGPGASARALWAAGWREAAGLGMRISLGLTALGLVDYGIQRWLYERELRMTRADVLEEIASLEGNPDLKRRRRRVAAGLKLRSPRPAGKGA